MGFMRIKLEFSFTRVHLPYRLMLKVVTIAISAIQHGNGADFMKERKILKLFTIKTTDLVVNAFDFEKKFNAEMFDPAHRLNVLKKTIAE